MNIQGLFLFPGKHTCWYCLQLPLETPAFSGWMQVVSCLPSPAVPGSRFFICVFCIRPYAKQRTHFPLSQRQWGLPLETPAKISFCLCRAQWFRHHANEFGFDLNASRDQGWEAERRLCTVLFLCTLCPQRGWLSLSGPPAPCSITQVPAAHFILTFGKGTQPGWIPWFACLVTASAGILLFFLRWEGMALFRLC